MTVSNCLYSECRVQLVDHGGRTVVRGVAACVDAVLAVVGGVDVAVRDAQNRTAIDCVQDGTADAARIRRSLLAAADSRHRLTTSSP